jgi:hypothetical protein
MRNGPEFLAVGVWCLFVTVIAVAHGPGTTATSAKPTAVASVYGDLIPMDKPITGRSAAFAANNGPYGALFIDPTIQDGIQPVQGPKPTSADLTVK